MKKQLPVNLSINEMRLMSRIPVEDKDYRSLNIHVCEDDDWFWGGKVIKTDLGMTSNKFCATAIEYVSAKDLTPGDFTRVPFVNSGNPANTVKTRKTVLLEEEVLEKLKRLATERMGGAPSVDALVWCLSELSSALVGDMNLVGKRKRKPEGTVADSSRMVSIRLPNDLFSALSTAAFRREITVGALVREICIPHLSGVFMVNPEEPDDFDFNLEED